MLVYLSGNKADLESERTVPTAKAQEFVKDKEIDYFCENSAKDGTNI